MDTRKRVLIVDDSALVRGIFTQLINADPRFVVVGAARDCFEAREMITHLRPDVLTLDVEMPRMDGLAFLRVLMREHPLPVLMISTLTAAGAPTTLEALSLGAVDFIEKPRLTGGFTLAEYGRLVVDRLAVAAGARPQMVAFEHSAALQGPRSASRDFLFAVGASTGGTEAIRLLLQGLPSNCPPTLIVQHIPAAFSESFAKRLDTLCPMRVLHAEHGQPVRAGEAYVAPGDNHMRLSGRAGDWHLSLRASAPVNRHCPSVEVLFDSMAAAAGARVAAALLTGMGADGAAALGRLKAAGAATFAQDEATSVVWGMPGVAARMGACDAVLPLQRIAAALMGAAIRSRARALANGP